MKSRVFSALFFLISLSIALGALGHGLQWEHHVRGALPGTDPAALALLAYVWYWVSGAMLVLGLLLLWVWWRSGGSTVHMPIVPGLIGAFYLVEGGLGAWFVGRFFLLFVAQALLLWLAAWGMGRGGSSRIE